MIDLKNIKLIVSEMDGIITEGLLPVGSLGFKTGPLFKEYYYKDFEAINEIKKYFKFVFLAKDNIINYQIAQDKQIPFFWHKTNKKHIILINTILPKYGIGLDNVLYIGCSYSDEKCMESAGKSVCPADSPTAVVGKSSAVLDTNGGCGVLMSFYDSIVVPSLSSI